jgi:hypothetical protein
MKLHPSITPDVISKAAEAGITGVKMYPQGRFPRPECIDVYLTNPEA